MIARGDPEWRKRVWLMLEDSNVLVVCLALEILSKHGERVDIPHIMPLLDRGDATIYGSALHAINHIDATLSVQVYLDMLRTPRAEKLACTYRFDKGEYDGQEDALFDGLKLLLTRKPERHLPILQLMKEYRPERLPEALELAVDAKVHWLVEDAIGEIASQPSPIAIPLYKKLMRRSDTYRRYGHRGLRRRVDLSQATALLQAALRGDDADVCLDALVDLRCHSELKVPLEDILPSIRMGSVRVRVQAAKTIVKYPDLRAFGELIVGAIDSAEEMREACISVLRSNPARNPVLKAMPQAGVRQRMALVGRLQALRGWGATEGECLLDMPVIVESFGEGVGLTRKPRKGSEVVIKVNFRPAIDGTPHGEDLVRGVILHELGHHLCDFGAKGMKAAAGAARAEGLRRWFNILIDERMERQLRARRSEWGIYFDRLKAHMFLRRHEDIPLPSFAAHHRLGLEETASGLRAGELPGEWIEHPAGMDKSWVRIRNRDLLRMPGILAPHQAFLICLRVGIKPPPGIDPRVAQALDLIPANLKNCTHWELVALCRKLAELLGGQDEMAREEEMRRRLVTKMLPKLLGLLEDVDKALQQAGIEDADEALPGDEQTIAEKEKPTINRSSSALGFAPRIHYDAKDKHFDRLQITQGPCYDDMEHRAIVAKIRKHIGPLRSHFVRLGCRTRDEYASRRGRRLDPAQARASVIRPSVQVLVHQRQTDDANLYLGIVIDCSGSMKGGKLERAKAFAVLLAESARQLPGIEGSIDAFNHHHFIRLGTFQRCAVTGLSANGGNNDAGALHEAAGLAIKSRKKNKLLIMISDGSPSECTFEALRNLVVQLECRHGILCAQVAVEPLGRIAFPHYVDLSKYPYSEAVRRFGQLLVKLTTPWR